MNIAPADKKHVSAPDITPLLDVVFLLLVFMLLTMTFTQEKDHTEEAVIDIELARSGTAAAQDARETLQILVDEKGSLYRPGVMAESTTEDIMAYVSEMMLGNPELEISLRADRRATHGQVVNALDMLKELGVKRVHLVIEKQSD